MPKKHNKMAIWYAISAVLLVVLAIIARQQIGLLLLKTIYTQHRPCPWLLRRPHHLCRVSTV